MKKQIWIPILVVVVIVVGVLIFSSQQKSATPQEKGVIKIGAILPLTGKATSLGEDIKNALSLALEKINVNKQNKQIELIYEDEMCDPQNAVTAYQSLRLKGVNIIIGAVCSPSTLAIAPLAEQDKVILITPASGADAISQAGDYIFRNHVFASQKGIKLGEFAAAKFDNIATIYDKSNDAIVLFEDLLVKNFQKKSSPKF